MNTDDAAAGIELLDFFVSAYGAMRDRWSAAFADTDCAGDAPWATRIDSTIPDTAPVTGAELLL
jgi:hypothetical protein